MAAMIGSGGQVNIGQTSSVQVTRSDDYQRSMMNEILSQKNLAPQRM